jgi:hypothetical protein
MHDVAAIQKRVLQLTARTAYKAQQLVCPNNGMPATAMQASGMTVSQLLR